MDWRGASISFIIFWKVVGELHRPKNITVGSQSVTILPYNYDSFPFLYLDSLLLSLTLTRPLPLIPHTTSTPDTTSTSLTRPFPFVLLYLYIQLVLFVYTSELALSIHLVWFRGRGYTRGFWYPRPSGTGLGLMPRDPQ